MYYWSYTIRQLAAVNKRLPVRVSEYLTIAAAAVDSLAGAFKLAPLRERYGGDGGRGPARDRPTGLVRFVRSARPAERRYCRNALRVYATDGRRAREDVPEIRTHTRERARAYGHVYTSTHAQKHAHKRAKTHAHSFGPRKDQKLDRYARGARATGAAWCRRAAAWADGRNTRTNKQNRPKNKTPLTRL